MLATEADVLRTLRTGTYTVSELYGLCEERTAVGRDGGQDPVPAHPGDRRWKRRVRGALETLRRTGRAERIGRTAWAIQGPPHHPARLLLIVAGATPRDFELRLQAATELLAGLDEPADLVLCDPPYGLRRGRGHFADGNGYRRDHTRVVGGYVDVDPGEYADFTHGWVQAAAAALRPAGQLAAITGPQRAAIVQCAAEQAGLTWVSTIAARRTFPLATLRRPASAHWAITVMCRGALGNPRRVFHPPADLPAARSGHPYPLDWWADGNGRADRPGLLRYDNSLPLPLVRRAVTAFSDRGEHVVDPFLGAGTTAVACWKTGRRFTGGDLNPAAVRFAAARLLDEHAWPDEYQPGLFPASEVSS
jgi:site-specific DNA-methyltransferase (adenine-specific)